MFVTVKYLSQIFNLKVSPKMDINELCAMIGDKIQIDVDKIRLIHENYVLKGSHTLSDFHIYNEHTIYVFRLEKEGT